MLKCQEVVQQADALLADELNLRQRIELRLHLLMCVHCRRYVRQLRKLVAAIPGMHGLASDEDVDKVMQCVHEHKHEHDQDR